MYIKKNFYVKIFIFQIRKGKKRKGRKKERSLVFDLRVSKSIGNAISIVNYQSKCNSPLQRDSIRKARRVARGKYSLGTRSKVTTG